MECQIFTISYLYIDTARTFGMITIPLPVFDFTVACTGLKFATTESVLPPWICFEAQVKASKRSSQSTHIYKNFKNYDEKYYWQDMILQIGEFDVYNLLKTATSFK